MSWRREDDTTSIGGVFGRSRAAEPPAGTSREVGIAFFHRGPTAWAAGWVHLANLLCAVQAVAGAGVRTFLVDADDDVERLLRGETGVVSDSLSIPRSPRWTARWLFEGLWRRVAGRDIVAERELRAHLVDAVFGNAIPLRARKVAMLSWIPDLQHLHLPELFSPQERLERSALYRRSVRLATTVVVTSESVARDLASFAPEAAAKVVVLRPATALPASVWAGDPEEVRRRFGLPERFFFLPGHLWQHKNHLAVATALAILRSRGRDVTVVASGARHDYRNPEFETHFFRTLADLGLSNLFLHLGELSRRDVLLLMRQAIAVINPSLFEGFSYALDEARALARPVIASDIPAHREHRLANAAFFPPGDAGALATVLERSWLEGQAGSEGAAEEHARVDNEVRVRSYGERFLSVVRAAIDAAR
jgi:glycosyltransferase involved in cell wall biosynthesis